MTTAMPQPGAEKNQAQEPYWPHTCGSHTVPSSRPAQPARPQADADGAAIAAVIALFFIAPLAIVLGHISRGTAKRHGLEPSAAATVACVLGYVLTVAGLIAVIAIVAAAASHSVPCDPSNPGWPAC